MSYISSDQLNQLIQEGQQQGLKPNDIVQGLLSQGHQISGLNAPDQNTSQGQDIQASMSGIGGVQGAYNGAAFPSTSEYNPPPAAQNKQQAKQNMFAPGNYALGQMSKLAGNTPVDALQTAAHFVFDPIKNAFSTIPQEWSKLVQESGGTLNAAGNVAGEVLNPKSLLKDVYQSAMPAVAQKLLSGDTTGAYRQFINHPVSSVLPFMAVAEGLAGGPPPESVLNKNVGDITKQGTATAVDLAAKGGQVLTDKTTPFVKGIAEHIYNSAIGTPPKIENAGLSPASDLMSKGFFGGGVGTLKGILNNQNDMAQAMNTAITQKLASSPASLDLNRVFEEVSNELNIQKNTNYYNPAVIKSYIAKVAPDLVTPANQGVVDVSEGNLLRSNLDKVLGQKSFMSQQLPIKANTLMQTTNAMRRVVQTLEPDTAPLFKDWSTAINTTKIIQAKLNKVGGNLIPMGDLIAGGFGGLKEGAGGFIKAIGGRELLGSTFMKTLTATGLDKVANIINFLGKIPQEYRANLLKELGQESSSVPEPGANLNK